MRGWCLILVDCYGEFDGYGFFDALGEVAIVSGSLGASPIEIGFILSAPDLDVGVDALDPVTLGIQ